MTTADQQAFRRPWWARLWSADPETRARRETARRLYAEVVNRARTPALFRELGVPDTPEGRFEMIALHAALVLRRLRPEGEAGRALGQELFDLMLTDFDVNLRELGVGDLSVGKYVKRLARNVYARIAALDEGLEGDEPAALEPMLRTNVYYGGPAPSPAQLEALASYLRTLDAELGEQPGEALLAGRLALATGGLRSPARPPI